MRYQVSDELTKSTLSYGGVYRMSAGAKAWADMTDRERDAEIAERVVGATPDRVWKFTSSDDNWVRDDVPHYTTDPTAARLVEDAIERRRLQSAYVMALMDVLGYPGQQIHEPSAKELWLLVTASPAQRCEAAWRALGDT